MFLRKTNVSIPTEILARKRRTSPKLRRRIGARLKLCHLYSFRGSEVNAYEVTANSAFVRRLIPNVEVFEDKDEHKDEHKVKERYKILPSIPKEVLGWSAEDFCRTFYEYDNFDLLLATWLERNVRPDVAQDQVQQAFNSLSEYWSDRAVLRSIKRGKKEEGPVGEGEPLSAGRMPELGEGPLTTKMKDVIFGAFSLLGRVSRPVWFFLILGTITSFAYTIYWATENYDSLEAAATSKTPEENLQGKSTWQLFRLLEHGTDYHQLNLAVKVLAQRAEESGQLLFAGQQYKTREDFLRNGYLQKPVFFRSNSGFIRSLTKDFDPKSAEAMKYVRWVLLTPNVRTTLKPERSYRIHGLSLGDGVVVISTEDIDGTYRDEVDFQDTIIHEACHEKNKAEGVNQPQRDEETESFGCSRDLDGHLAPLAESRGKKETAERFRDFEATNSSRVEVGEYYKTLGSAFAEVYPETKITSRALLEEKISVRILEEHQQERREPAQLAEQMRTAVKAALIVRRHDNPREAEALLREMIKTGSNMEKWQAHFALEFLLHGTPMSSDSRRVLSLSDLPEYPEPSQGKTKKTGEAAKSPAESKPVPVKKDAGVKKANSGLITAGRERPSDLTDEEKRILDDDLQRKIELAKYINNLQLRPIIEDLLPVTKDKRVALWINAGRLNLCWVGEDGTVDVDKPLLPTNYNKQPQYYPLIKLFDDIKRKGGIHDLKLRALRSVTVSDLADRSIEASLISRIMFVEID